MIVGSGFLRIMYIIKFLVYLLKIFNNSVFNFLKKKNNN